MARQTTPTPADDISFAPRRFTFQRKRDEYLRERSVMGVRRGTIVELIWYRLNLKQAGRTQPIRTILHETLQTLDPEPLHPAYETWGMFNHDGLVYYLRDIRVVSSLVIHWLGSDEGITFVRSVRGSEPDRYLTAFVSLCQRVDIVAQVTRERACVHGSGRFAHERARLVITAFLLWLSSDGGQAFLNACNLAEVRVRTVFQYNTTRRHRVSRAR